MMDEWMDRNMAWLVGGWVDKQIHQWMLVEWINGRVG